MRPGRVEHEVAASLRGALRRLGTDARPAQPLRPAELQASPSKGRRAVALIETGAGCADPVEDHMASTKRVGRSPWQSQSAADYLRSSQAEPWRPTRSGSVYHHSPGRMDEDFGEISG